MTRSTSGDTPGNPLGVRSEAGPACLTPSGMRRSWWSIIAIVAALCSFIPGLIYYCAEWGFRHDHAPWGFHYQLVLNETEECGRISYLNPDKIKQVFHQYLDGIATDEHALLIFQTRVFVSTGATFDLHLSPVEQTKIFIDGQPVSTAPNKKAYYQPLSLSTGWHSVTIHYFSQPSAPYQARFVLMNKSFPAIPFYNYTLPGDTISGMLSLLLRNIAKVRHFGYYLAFLILLIVLLVRIKTFPQAIFPSSTPSLCFYLAEFCCLGCSFLMLVLFIKGFFKIPLNNFWLIVLVIATAILVSKPSSTRRSWYIDRRSMGENILLTALSFMWVSTYVYLKSSELFPMRLIGTGDVRTHLLMIDYIRDTDHFFLGGEWGPIYPQALHALVALLCDIAGLGSQQIITVMLIAMMSVMLITLFHLARLFLPGLGLGSYFLMIAFSNLPFLLYSLFSLYSFPAICAVLFFLQALYFLLNERYLLSAMLLTSALLSYPYFTAVFCLVIFLFLSVDRINKGYSIERACLSIVTYFIVPCLYVIIYLITFAKVGYAQHEQGFESIEKLVPFDFLTNVNTLLVVIGLVWCLKKRSSKELALLALGTIIGFLLYYMPYRFWSVQTAYYLMKNMHYLILIGVIYSLAGVTAFVDKFAVGPQKQALSTAISLMAAFALFWFWLS